MLRVDRVTAEALPLDPTVGPARRMIPSKPACLQDWRPHMNSKDDLGLYDSRFGGFERVITRQQAVAMGDLEQSADAFGNSDDAESAIGSLAVREHADDASQAGRIHVRHRAKVHDHGMGGLLTGNLLEIEQSLERQRPGQLHDSGPFGAVDQFDGQVFGSAGSHVIHFTQR
jgi:hypothetical protein